MGFWGGGAGAGGWSTGIGGQSQGPRGPRNSDGWDDEELGKVYDSKVVRRLWPYIREYKWHALTAFIAMVVSAVSSFLQPLLIGLTVEAGLDHDTDRIWTLLIIMLSLATLALAAAMTQQLCTAWM